MYIYMMCTNIYECVRPAHSSRVMSFLPVVGVGGGEVRGCARWQDQRLLCH